MPSKNAKNAQTAQPQQQKKRGGWGWTIAAAILLIIIVGGSYAYFAYGWLPKALIGIRSYNATAMEAILFSRIDSMNSVAINYTGSIIVNNTDPSVLVNFIKYHNSSRTFALIKGLPVFGNMSTAVFANGQQVQDICVESWNTSVAPTTSCAFPNNSSATDAVQAVLGRFVNTSSISNFNISSYSISSWNFQPCYYTSGSGSVMINGVLVNQTGFVPANFTFKACLDAQYGVPDYMNVTMHAGGKFIHSNIKETGLTTTLDNAQITTLSS